MYASGRPRNPAARAHGTDCGRSNPGLRDCRPTGPQRPPALTPRQSPPTAPTTSSGRTVRRLTTALRFTPRADDPNYGRSSSGTALVLHCGGVHIGCADCQRAGWCHHRYSRVVRGLAVHGPADTHVAWPVTAAKDSFWPDHKPSCRPRGVIGDGGPGRIVCQPGERLECCVRGRNCHYLVVLPEAAFECRLDRVASLQIRIDDE
jgi:hypothetical protein